MPVTVWEYANGANAVLLAEDHTLVRQGLRVLLEKSEFDVVADVANGQEAIRAAVAVRPDVAVLDLMMPVMNGLEASRVLRRRVPSMNIVMLSIHSSEQYVLEALRAGVSGYVLKTRAASDLIGAVREACRGNTYLSPAITTMVVNGYLEKGAGTLTEMERLVLQLVSEGKSTGEIAEKLGISPDMAASAVKRFSGA